MAKLSKVKQIESIVNDSKDKFTRCLATGKTFWNGVEIPEHKFNAIKNKTVLINLGAGVKPE